MYKFESMPKPSPQPPPTHEGKSPAPGENEAPPRGLQPQGLPRLHIIIKSRIEKTYTFMNYYTIGLNFTEAAPENNNKKDSRLIYGTAWSQAATLRLQREEEGGSKLPKPAAKAPLPASASSTNDVKNIASRTSPAT